MADLANQSDEVDCLIFGSRCGDMEDVQTALDEYKISPDAADEQGRTGLHMASANGHTTIVSLLIQRGANVLAENGEGNTPLHWACLNGQEQVVQLLMSNGASAAAINSKARGGENLALMKTYDMRFRGVLLRELHLSFSRQGRTPVDEVLGKPFQDSIIAIVNSHSAKTDSLDDTDDPETHEMEDAPPEDPDLKPYNKYG